MVTLKKWMPGLVCYIFVSLMVLTSAHGAMLIDESFENGYGPFISEYPGRTSVISDSTAPLGSHVLQMKFPEGFSAGNAPDIFGATYSPANEIYSSFYFKISSGFVFDAYEQKLVFWWGNGYNFYVAVGSWGDKKMYGCWQGDGRVYRNASGPDIKTGVWYKVDVRLTSSGIFQLWLNGSQVLNVNNVPLAGGFYNMAFTPVYGGSGPPDTIPQDQYIWFDGAKVSTTPLLITDYSGSPGSSITPAPPSNLRVD